jgi:DNA-binding MarR family transcriptional regulator
MPWRYNDQQRVAFFEVLCELQKMASSLGLKLLHFILLTEIAAGDTEGTPWDITSLSLHLGLPRETVARTILTLTKKGWMEPRHASRRIVYVRTKEGIKYWRPRAHEMMERMIGYVRENHPPP